MLPTSETPLTANQPEPGKSVIYAQAVKIASKVLGQDVSAAVGAIDPAIFALIDAIFGWILQILDKCNNVQTNKPAAVAAVRRPSYLQRMKLRVKVRNEIPAKFAHLAMQVSDEICATGVSISDTELDGAISELTQESFITI